MNSELEKIISTVKNLKFTLDEIFLSDLDLLAEVLMSRKKNGNL